MEIHPWPLVFQLLSSMISSEKNKSTIHQALIDAPRAAVDVLTYWNACWEIDFWILLHGACNNNIFKLEDTGCIHTLIILLLL